MRSRAGVFYLAWGAVAGRSKEIAEALGGEAFVCFAPSGQFRPPIAIRYPLSALRTVGQLIIRRPRALIITNPPVIPGLIGLAYGALTRVPVILDDHPGSFGAQGDTRNGRFLFVHQRMALRARICLVTDSAWVEVVRRWGGRAMVLHESPGNWRFVTIRRKRDPRTVLFVCTFAADEPVDIVIEAARLRPDLRFVITGDLTKRPAEYATDSPSNVEWCGFLSFEDYQRSVYDADAVVALTTEPTSAIRAAFEAVWAGAPLVASDWPLISSLFPYADRCRNDPESLASSIDNALSRPSADPLLKAAEHLQRARWTNQLTELREHLHSMPRR